MGNSVVVPVIECIALQMKEYLKNYEIKCNWNN
jgi:site-specific DNA-cytosine methylase